MFYSTAFLHTWAIFIECIQLYFIFSFRFIIFAERKVPTRWLINKICAKYGANNEKHKSIVTTNIKKKNHCNFIFPAGIYIFRIIKMMKTRRFLQKHRKNEQAWNKKSKRTHLSHSKNKAYEEENHNSNKSKRR